MVFKGTAVGDAEPVGNDLADDSSWTQERYRMRVDRYFKGRLGRDIDVFTSARKTDCGFVFDRGTSYLVYAQLWEDGTVGVPFCSGTIPSSEADEVLSSWGKGVAPDRSLDVVRESSEEEDRGCSVSVPNTRAGFAASAIGAVLLLGVASLRRRGRAS